MSVGGIHADPYPVILDCLTRSLTEISRDRGRIPARGEDSLPLVALPVIGIGRGGYSGDRGSVLRDLVGTLVREARRQRLDLALVTPDPSVYAAAQYARRGLSPDLPSRLEELAENLGAQAHDGSLALLLGAGVSAAAGLPTWNNLLDDLARDYSVEEPDSIAQLTPTDRAELIERVAGRDFKGRVAAMIGHVTRSSLLHALLAGLDCHEVVTTNYDILYEQAVRATDREITSVMPWATAHDAERWILKLHGDVDHPEAIVLTRRHMLRYDAANRPSAAVLQALLLTRHLLIVGVSMTDDNIIRLAYEVEEYRQHHQEGRTDTFGTVLDTSGDHLRSQLWENQLDWVHLPDQGPWAGRRAQELFLDRVAFHASRNSSWLLDERFEGLLDHEAERQLAANLRALYRTMPDPPDGTWAPVVNALKNCGVDSGQASTQPLRPHHR